jgi:ankyrin repeat protein
MSTYRSLPSQPNLEQLRNQAKILLKAIRAGDPEALARFRAANPQIEFLPDGALSQANIRNFAGLRVIAREAGFPEWTVLTRYVAEGNALPPEGTLARFVGAVEAPDPEAVQEILGDYPYLARARVYDEEDCNFIGNTLLHRVYSNSNWSHEDKATDAHLEVARLLIEHGADVNATGGAGDSWGETPLGATGWAGSLRMVQLLLDHGASPNHVSDGGMDALENIAIHSKPAMVEAMIAAGARIEPRHLLLGGLKERFTAMLDSEPERVNQRIPINMMEGVAGTLLHLAVDCNQPDMVRLLLARGADVDALDNRSRSPLHRALSRGNDALVQMLIDHGAAVNITAAIGMGDRARVAGMLDEDADLVQQSRVGDGWTPLHVAVGYDQPDMVVLLLERGADVDAVSDAGDPPLSLADERGEKIRDLLIAHGAKP